jgi:hypothetical protein
VPIAKSRRPANLAKTARNPPPVSHGISWAVDTTVKSKASSCVYSSFIGADKNTDMFATSKPQDTTLEPGARYRAREGGIWELRGLVNVLAKQPHVMLFDVHDHKITKVVSVHALMDSSLFKRVEATSERKVPAKTPA